MLLKSGHNPDILTCLANLSADEVFTPPKLASAMLDLLPQDLFSRPDSTFLDPFCKSGVFLREIALRLNDGLRDQMPDTQARVDHILMKQVFGLGITELTALLARRSVYCSKKADGKFSIATKFATAEGNIPLPRTKHRWNGNGKCEDCGASRGEYDRGEALEAYAYPFIHGIDPREIFNVKFDVIVGNPPYHLSGGAGGSSDSSLYHDFVQQAFKLRPRYAAFVIPSRWMAGGRGMDEFRALMLTGGKLRSLTDFPDSGDAFPGVQIKGGVCYFLWEDAYSGPCNVTRVAGGEHHLQSARKLGEFDVFVRDERGLAILRKVLSKKEPSVAELISGDTPFGVPTNFGEWSSQPQKKKIELHLINKSKRTVGYMDREIIRKNTEAVDLWKVLVPKAYGAGETFPHQILGKEIVAAPPSACTQSYLIVTPLRSEKAALSFASYYRTRLFRFLVSLRKITQDAMRSTYTWVPQQTWDRAWSDDLLCKKYEINATEFAYIESMIRPMEGGE